MFFRVVFSLSVLALVAGCTLSPVDTGRGHMFALGAVPIAPAAGKPVALVLSVARPTSPDTLDTARVALLQDGRRWDYYASARWADFLPDMVQASAVKALSDAKVFRAVMPDDAGVAAGLLLKPDIRAFQAVYETKGQAPVVKVQLEAVLMTAVSRKTLIVFSATTQSAAAQDSLPAIQKAFSQAYNRAIGSLVRQMEEKAAADGAAWEKAVPSGT